MKSSEPSDKALAAMQFLEACPTTIEQALLADEAFVEEFEIPTTSRITIGRLGPQFDQDTLFERVAAFADDAGEIEITDEDGNAWRLHRNQEARKDSLFISHGERTYSVHHLHLLTNDRAMRLRQLDSDQLEVQLPNAEYNEIRNIIKKRPLTAEEFLDYSQAIAQTPLAIAKAISAAMGGRNISNDALAPRSNQYWHRLLGVLKPLATEDYLASFAEISDNIFPTLSAKDRFRLLLHYGAHNRMTPDLAKFNLTSEDLEELVSSLLSEGDTLSIVSMILTLVPFLSDFPKAKEWISELYEKILPSRTNDFDEAFRFLSAFSIFVYTELAKHELLWDFPPSLRRHAAITQATLIERAAKMRGVDLDRFSAPARTQHGFPFWVAALMDVREEPLWYADLIDSEQLARECAMRIHQQAVLHQNLVAKMGLTDVLIIDNKPWINASNLMLAVLPGPMEGVRANSNPLPDDFYKSIEKSLTDDDITDRSFIAIVNTALVHDIPSDLVDHAINALRRQDRLIVPEKDNNILAGLYRGLARLAAASRSKALAEEVMAGLRQHLSRFPDDIDAANFIEAGITACGAYQDPDEWREVIGKFFTDLGFRSKNDEFNTLARSTINWLLQLDRSLWVSCGKAQAIFSTLDV